jgi:hypothetical protein
VVERLRKTPHQPNKLPTPWRTDPNYYTPTKLVGIFGGMSAKDVAANFEILIGPKDEAKKVIDQIDKQSSFF